MRTGRLRHAQISASPPSFLPSFLPSYPYPTPLSYPRLMPLPVHLLFCTKQTRLGRTFRVRQHTDTVFHFFHFILLSLPPLSLIFLPPPLILSAHTVCLPLTHFRVWRSEVLGNFFFLLLPLAVSVRVR